MNLIQKLKDKCQKLRFGSGNFQRGFTLIELMVVFSTIGMLSTLGIASFVSYSRTQALNQATLDLSTYLNLAKSRARTQIKPPNAQNCGLYSSVNYRLLGYQVRIVDDTNYWLEISCIASDNAVFTYAIDDGKKTLPNGNSTKNIVFSQTTISKTFLFKVLNGGVDFSLGATGSDTIDVLGYGNQCKKITVYNNAKIAIKDGTKNNGTCSVQ